MDHKSVMVVGGGIAGIQAALDLAEMGVEVFLVENNPSIGGRMAQLDKTFPTNDCAMCILSPKLVEAGRGIGFAQIRHGSSRMPTCSPWRAKQAIFMSVCSSALGTWTKRAAQAAAYA